MNLKKQPAQSQTNRNEPARAGVLPTFLEHIRELRGRLFWIAGFIILAASAAFPFNKQIMDVITAPLDGEQLYYLTPIGGFSFLIKVCTYVGILAGIPIIMYHVYRFLEPLMRRGLKKSVLFYVLASSFLAIGGMTFAYFISLPAALHFLTNINIGQVEAMLTVDSYLSFVMTYLLGAALLFQIPLILLIINGISPLPPKQLMGAQRYVVLGAFIIAAIISPTPDVVNQSFLAAPIVVMYQVGIGSVWVQQRRRGKVRKIMEAPVAALEPPPEPQQEVRAAPVTAVKVQAPYRQPARSLDGFGPGRRQPQLAVQPRPAAVSVRPARRYPAVPARSVDGISIRRAPLSPAA